MTARERILLIVVGTVGILLLWYFYIFAPLRAENRRLNTELATKRQQLARMEETVKLIPQLEQEYARLQTFIAEIEAKLPPEKEVPTLIVQLERLARAVGIDLQAIKPAPLQGATATAQAPAPPRPAAGGQQPPPPAAPPYLRFPIGLAIRATYAEMLELTSRLNNFPRLIAVRRITLAPRGGPEEVVPTLTADLDVETFVLPREAR